ncbi:MAG TPA: hypothetical protein VM869_15330 [Enhygromyxa sp.]|nr:hypothetical protein [Enhygromyxa sp.]
MATDPSWTSSDKREAARARLASNPFYVLGLRPDCARAEIEREGQKLIGMLELELSAAATYRSPIGEHRRTPELVREAMAELRDPNRRLLHELWATLEPAVPAPSSASADEDDEANLAPFPALRALGFGDWGRR